MKYQSFYRTKSGNRFTVFVNTSQLKSSSVEAISVSEKINYFPLKFVHDSIRRSRRSKIRKLLSYL